jgi:tRNA threonylcarbamoyladenosine biosynthesis protein TsaB
VLVLSLDTTTRGGSAAVLDDDRVLALVDGDATRTHGERLPGELDAALTAAGVSLGEIDLLAVACGPGAFTGLRIGLAAMQGLAMVQRCPVIGVSALDALAVAAAASAAGSPGAGAARVGAWMDAARGEVFAALYDAPPGDTPLVVRMVGEPTVAAPDVTWRAWEAAAPPPTLVCGDGAVRYAATLGTAVIPLAPPPLAPIVARLARAAATAGARGRPHQLQPLYVRRPDAERQG